MSLKRNIYFNARTQGLLSEALEDGNNLSGRIGEVVDRYFTLVDIARREVLAMFSEKEITSIKLAFDAWNKKGLLASAFCTGLGTAVQDAVQMGVLKKWANQDPVGAEQLMSKTKALLPTQQIALVELFERAQP